MNLNNYVDEIIEKYKSGISSIKLAKEYNCNKSTICRLLKKNNIEMKNPDMYKTYFFDEHFLDIVNTEEKAYFLGLMYSDGYNIKNKNEFGISLSGEDSYMIENIRKILKTDKPIYIRYPKQGQAVFELRLSSEYFSNRLSELGCFVNKSLKLEFPNFLSNELVRHFIRGYFDGDGSVMKINKNGHRVSFIGTESFCIGLQTILKKFLDIDSHLIKQGKVYYLRFSKKKCVEKFFNWIYDNSTIYLLRKYNKFI